MTELLTFHGHKVSSIGMVLLEYVRLGCTLNRRYLGWDYSELGKHLVSHFKSLCADQYNVQYKEVCDLCLHYIEQIDRNENAGKKAQLILGNIIHPCFRTNAGDDQVLQKACECYSRLNATQWYIADELKDLLVKQADPIIQRKLLLISVVEKLVDEWAYSDDPRKRGHAIDVIKTYYSKASNKRRMKVTLDVLSNSEETRVPAAKALADLDITAKRERHRKLVMLLKAISIIIGTIAAVVTVIELLSKISYSI